MGRIALLAATVGVAVAATIIPAVSPATRVVAASANWDPSGQAMPVGDLPGWHQVFADNFANDALPVGSFTGCGSKGCVTTPGLPWGGSPDGKPDTSRHCVTYPSKTLSIAGGVMNIFVHTDPSGTCMDASIYPLIPKLTYETYSIRFRGDPAVGYKEVGFLWPVDGVHGEIDFPENHLESPVTGSLHTFAGGSPIQRFTSAVASTTWHTATTQWTPTSVTFLLDGAIVGSTSVDVPQTPMTLLLRAESDLAPAPVPAPTSQGNLQIDWVTVYSYAPSPSITSVTPQTIGQGSTSSTLLLTGPGFTPDAKVSFSSPGITEAGPVAELSPNQLSVPVKVESTVPPGASDATVTEAVGSTTCSGCVTVVSGPGQLSVSASAVAGQTVPVTIMGSNLLTGLSVSSSAPGARFGPSAPVALNAVTVPVTVPAKTPGGSYDLTVTNPNGGTVTCSSCFAVTTRPTAPLIGTATAGNGQATVTFSAPASDGGSLITSYSVIALDLTNPARGGQSQSGLASPVTVTGIVNGDHYKFRVLAGNVAGIGPPSVISNLVVPAIGIPA